MPLVKGESFRVSRVAIICKRLDKQGAPTSLNCKIRLQPEGLADSRRWSERSADHRRAASSSSTPEGCQSLLATLQVAEFFALVYRWSALRSDPRLLSNSPPG